MTNPNITPLASRAWPNDITDPVYFINDQWAVTGFGLERTTDGKPYEWDADRLLATHHDRGGPPGSAVLSHIGPKTWVDVELLIEAFRQALAVHHHGAATTFDLEAEEALLRSLKAGT